MKSFFMGLLALGSIAVYAGGDYTLECIAMDSDDLQKPLYDDVFTVEVNEKSLSHISYRRKYEGATEYSRPYSIRGCYHAKLLKDSVGGFEVGVECQSNGEEGLFAFSPSSMTGVIHFYYPKIGYPERTGLRLSCRKI